MGEIEKLQSDLVHLCRISIDGSHKDVLFFQKRLVRQYRKTNPELAEQIFAVLRKHLSINDVMR
jgi:hypothetical protein